MALLLVAFVGLSRTSEALTLTVRQLQLFAVGGRLVISLPSTKTSAARGGTEVVMVTDAKVIAAVRLACRGLGDDDRLYPNSM